MPVVTARDIPIRLILIDPPPGVDFGIQRGHGSDCEVVGVQRSHKGNLVFDFIIRVTDDGKSAAPNFTGPFAQGPRDGRFFYVGVGTYAGQMGTPWSRRMKVPLAGITSAQIREAAKKPGRLCVSVTGTGKDGGPSCATVRPIDGWTVEKVKS